MNSVLHQVFHGHIKIISTLSSSVAWLVGFFVDLKGISFAKAGFLSLTGNISIYIYFCLYLKAVYFKGGHNMTVYAYTTFERRYDK